ncbi:ethionine resistance protein [Coemansia sp. RSA 2049]|nr:ethionine resistance protein [Coemansia sp. RSA 2049]KAJ2693819.1 ethionine resistance protein [Coemansia sp. RSA 1285]
MDTSTGQGSATQGPEPESTWLLTQSTDIVSATKSSEEEEEHLSGYLAHCGINNNGSVAQTRKHAEADSVTTTTIVAQEAKRLVKNSTPIVMSYLLEYSFTFINMYVLGHIGSDELAASGLVNMVIIVFVFSPSIGLAVALETFCSTAFTASQDKTLVGFHLQRGIIAVTLYFVCISPLLWYLETILLLLNQEPRIAMLCGSFMRVNMAGALPWMCYECIKCYLQAQEIMNASTYILLVVTPLHVVNCYLFVWSPALGLGFLGAAVSSVLTNWLMLAAIVLCVRYSSARETWGGWTIRAFKSMPQYFQLALPSMVMLCAEWWILDLLVLASSYLGSMTLAAQGIAINTCAFTYQFADGVGVAVCNRIGNLLGQARARRAKLTAWLGLGMGVVIGVSTLTIAVCVASWWGSIYSDDPQVVAHVAALMPACAVFQMLDAMNSTGSGVLRSLGRQDAGAPINFVAYYLVGFPLGLYLTYGRPQAGVVGLWYGIGAGVALAVLMQQVICVRTDWNCEVKKCMERVSEDTLAFANDNGHEEDEEEED